MKKLFIISPPTNAKTKEEILAERNKAIEVATNFCGDAVKVISEDYKPDNGCVSLKYLAHLIEFMADADIVYFAPYWNKSRACRIAHECAISYAIQTIGDDLAVK